MNKKYYIITSAFLLFALFVIALVEHKMTQRFVADIEKEEPEQDIMSVSVDSPQNSEWPQSTEETLEQMLNEQIRLKKSLSTTGDMNYPVGDYYDKSKFYLLRDEIKEQSR